MPPAMSLRRLELAVDDDPSAWHEHIIDDQLPQRGAGRVDADAQGQADRHRPVDVAGVLAMLIGYGLIRGVKNRDYLAWRQGREPLDMLENFASENAALTGVGRVLIGLGAALALGGVLLWFAR